jgi:hypothetical protein
MEVYDKHGITINIYEDSIVIRDDSNAGYISCARNNIPSLLEGLRRMEIDPSDYRNQNCFNGHEFLPTIGCDGNYIILSHIPRIIKAIKSGNKTSFKLNELNDFSLQELNDVVVCLRSSNSIIKGKNKIDIIFYSI